MFQLLHNFIDWFVTSWKTIFDLISHGIQSLLSILNILPQLIGYTNSALSHLPNIFVPFAYLGLLVSIVYLIVNRKAGGHN